MKRMARVLGLLALTTAASPPVRADYALVQFDDGHCQIWWDSVTDPWGVNWRKLVIASPDWEAARAALANARAQNVCPS